MFQRIKKGDEREAVGGDVSSQLRPGRGKDWVDGRVFSFLFDLHRLNIFLGSGVQPRELKEKGYAGRKGKGGGSRGSEVDGCRGEEVVALS